MVLHLTVPAEAPAQNKQQDIACYALGKCFHHNVCIVHKPISGSTCHIEPMQLLSLKLWCNSATAGRVNPRMQLINRADKITLIKLSQPRQVGFTCRANLLHLNLGASESGCTRLSAVSATASFVAGQSTAATEAAVLTTSADSDRPAAGPE